jgi:hypothetical protein
MTSGHIDVIQQKVCGHPVIRIIPLNKGFGKQIGAKGIIKPRRYQVCVEITMIQIEVIITVTKIDIKPVSYFCITGKSNILPVPIKKFTPAVFNTA